MSPIIAKKAEASGIIKCLIHSNQGGQVDITPGIVDFKYYESLTQNTLKVLITFVDTAYTINGTTTLEGLPIVGQERVEIELEDNFENTKTMTLYVNTAIPNYEKHNKHVVNLELVSKDFIMSEFVRVRKRYDGKISDSVTKILTDPPPFGLATDQPLDIEQTSNLYNFLGNNRKPFWILNWLSKKSIPDGSGGGRGCTAGFFFFETDKGFNFKSIDTMMKEKPVLKLIWNESVDEQGKKIPKGYDGKIITFNLSKSTPNVKNRLRSGSYNTKIVTWNPFTFEFKTFDQKLEECIEKGGKELPKLNDDVFPNKQDGSPTKTVWLLEDPGTLPTGDTEQQLKKSDKKNLEDTDIINYANMRYNSLFAVQASLNIAGYLNLNVGQTIFIDHPKIEESENPDVSETWGGKYLILDLCHSFNGNQTITSLNVVRESMKR